jgi:hypothetical protein
VGLLGATLDLWDKISPSPPAASHAEIQNLLVSQHGSVTLRTRNLGERRFNKGEVFPATQVTVAVHNPLSEDIAFFVLRARVSNAVTLSECDSTGGGLISTANYQLALPRPHGPVQQHRFLSHGKCAGTVMIHSPLRSAIQLSRHQAPCPYIG